MKLSSRIQFLIKRTAVNFSTRFLVSVGIVSLAFATAIPLPVSAEPAITPRMVGGQYTNLRSTAVAFIYTGRSLCSGTLVGPREILTAAHCVQNWTDRAFVFVGNNSYQWSEAYHHSAYNPEGSVVENAKYDIALILLKTEVYNVDPIPVLSGKPMTEGSEFGFSGYGTHEYSHSDANLNDILSHGKHGNFVVSSLYSGWFEAAFSATHTAVCAGDSGGPAMQEVDGATTVVGLVSYGNSTNEANEDCVAGYMTDSGFVDIQGSAARGFLSNFNGVLRHNYTPPPVVNPHAAISGKAKLLYKEAGQVKKIAVLRTLRTKASRLSSKVLAAAYSADADYDSSKLLTRAYQDLYRAALQTNLKSAQQIVGQAATRIKKVADMK